MRDFLTGCHGIFVLIKNCGNLRHENDCYMYIKITEDVKVSVETFYQENASMPDNGHFVFAYRITIENCSENTVRLLKRHWHILNSNGVKKDIEGEGVVGRQPVIEPGKSYQYVSGCDLQSDLGKMYGSYTMENQNNGRLFNVSIPDFILTVPYRLN